VGRWETKSIASCWSRCRTPTMLHSTSAPPLTLTCSIRPLTVSRLRRPRRRCARSRQTVALMRRVVCTGLPHKTPKLLETVGTLPCCVEACLRRGQSWEALNATERPVGPPGSRHLLLGLLDLQRWTCTGFEHQYGLCRKLRHWFARWRTTLRIITLDPAPAEDGRTADTIHTPKRGS
jgi:hypothetical protein